MRRRLVLVFLAVSTLVATAFVIPLGFLISRTAEDRAIDGARADAAAVVPALVAGGTQAQVEAAIGATTSGSEGRMGVMTAAGMRVGRTPPSSLVDAALQAGDSNIGETEGGIEVVAAVATGPGELSAIQVFVPDDELQRGQWRAWAVLAGVGAALVAISVFVADRLARTVVEPTRDLATAARQLGAGELDASVTPAGPDELVDLANVFNDLGRRVSTMLDRERELVADLSHRLRTPLTKLRLRVDQVDDEALAAQLHHDVDDVTKALNELILEARGATDPGATTDMNAVAAERAEFWQVLAEDQLRPWLFRAADGPLTVATSTERLAAVVDVLVENVFSHTPDGCAVVISTHRNEGTAELTVSDAGPGMQTDQGERGTSGSGSTGLGLDIAQTLASEVGGAFRVDKGDLGGAEVVLSLPIVRDI